ncbi:MAG: amidase [Pseudomonadota bacterium]|nr:amidase [Pseudomonadota bacterium]
MAGDLGAFRLRLDIDGRPPPDAPLGGLSFAVKDVIDVKGVTTGGGNPDWLRTHAPASKNAPVVEALLEAGAHLAGITIADELAFGLSGENVHYGTPVNPAAPDAIPGGSSSGSAVAVAGRLVDFALGTDTAGSIRVPASYCGVFGMRPSHHSVPVDGVMALSPSCDTVGWLARESGLLLRAGCVLLGRPQNDGATGNRLERALMLGDAMELADPASRPALDAALDRLRNLPDKVDRTNLSDDHYADWLASFNRIRVPEIWGVFGDWITRTRPRFGPQVARRFADVRESAKRGTESAQAFRRRVTARLTDLLRDDTVLVLPTTPGPAPCKGLDDRESDRIRVATMRLTCIAPMCGVPQVSVPMATVDGRPLGLSLIGPRHADLALMRLAQELSGA